MHIVFDPYDPEDRRKAQEAINQMDETERHLQAVPAALVLELPPLLANKSASILIAAANHFNDGESFSWPDLATKINKGVSTVLSWNRQLGRSLKKLRLNHGDLLVVKPGKPKRFEMPGPVRQFIKETVATG